MEASKDKSSKKKDKSAQEPIDVPTGPFVEKTKEEVAKMSKEDRGKYYAHKMAHEKASGGGGGKQKMTKEEMRKLQEAQRKVKEDKANASKDSDTLLEELKLQGLTEEQAREMAKAMHRGDAEDEDEEDDDEGADDLLGSVRRWMSEQTEVSDNSVNDFNLKVRFQGHVDSTPPDHLGAILNVLVEQMCVVCDLSAPKLNPQTVCKAFLPPLQKWAPLLRSLIETIDVLEAVNVIVQTLSKALSGAEKVADKDSSLVGCLMAVREIDDLVEDEDLVIGCKSVEPTTVVMDKFIEFLDEDDDDDDDDDDEDDDK